MLELMGSRNSYEELGLVLDSIRMERNQQNESLFAIRDGRLRYGKPIFLAIAIGAFNQLSGINAILYSLTTSFQQPASAAFQAIGKQWLLEQ